jgi:hypothetical protein
MGETLHGSGEGAVTLLEPRLLNRPIQVQIEESFPLVSELGQLSAQLTGFAEALAAFGIEVREVRLHRLKQRLRVPEKARHLAPYRALKRGGAVAGGMAPGATESVPSSAGVDWAAMARLAVHAGITATAAQQPLEEAELAGGSACE